MRMMDILKRLDLNVGNFTKQFCLAMRMMDILKRLDLNVGNFTKQFCLAKNKNRIKNMKRKMSADGKAYRKHKRAQRKGFQDEEADKEGEVYGTGEF